MSFRARSPTAQAATDYFVFIPGVPGESRVQGRNNWIDAFGFSTEVAAAPVLEGVGGGVPEMPPIYVGKRIDKASPLLTRAISIGTRFDSATLEMVDHHDRAHSLSSCVA